MGCLCHIRFWYVIHLILWTGFNTSWAHYNKVYFLQNTGDTHCSAGLGVTKSILSIAKFPSFSESSDYWFSIEYHIHIWQVSTQLSCDEACQIVIPWTLQVLLHIIENIPNWEIIKLSFSNPHPWWGVFYGIKSDLCFIFVSVMMYVISHYFVPCCNF